MFPSEILTNVLFTLIGYQRRGGGRDLMGNEDTSLTIIIPTIIIIIITIIIMVIIIIIIREEMEDVTMSIFDLMGNAEDTSLSNFLVKQKVVEVFQVNY